MASLPPPPKKKEKNDDPLFGITFNEIHSDEPHEEIDALKSELYNKPLSSLGGDHTKTSGLFNVARVFKNDQIDTGMIVSDKKAQRSGFIENVQSAFNEWLGKVSNQASKIAHTELHTPQKISATIEKVESRAAVVQEALRNATLAPKDDHHIVIQKIRTFKQDVERVTGKTQPEKSETNNVPHESTVRGTGSVTPGTPRQNEKVATILDQNTTTPEKKDTAITQTKSLPLPPKKQVTSATPVRFTTPDLRGSMVAPVIEQRLNSDLQDFAPKKKSDEVLEKNTPDKKVSTPAVVVPAPPVKHIETPVVSTGTKLSIAPVIHKVTRIEQPEAKIIPAPPKNGNALQLKSILREPTKVSPSWTHVKDTDNEEQTENIDAKKHLDIITPKVEVKPLKMPEKKDMKALDISPLQAPRKTATPTVVEKIIPRTKPEVIPETPQQVTRAKAPTSVVTPSTTQEIQKKAEEPVAKPQTNVPQQKVPVVSPSIQPEAPSVPVNLPFEDSDGSDYTVTKEEDFAIQEEVIADTNEYTPEEPAFHGTPDSTPLETQPVGEVLEYFPALDDSVSQTYETQRPKTAAERLAELTQNENGSGMRPLLRTTLTVIGVLILTGIAILVFIIFKHSSETREAVPSFTETNNNIGIKMTGDTRMFLATLKEKLEEKPSQTYLITPTIPTTEEGIEREATSKELLQFLEVRLDSKAQRALNDTIKIGSIATSKNEPFIILQSTQFDTFFSGMLSWETYLYEDFLPLFGKDQLEDYIFVDAVRGNASTRILYNKDKEEVLLYSFVTKNKVVITTSGEALAKILEAKF